VDSPLPDMSAPPVLSQPDLEQTLKVASNSVELLSEMLGPLSTPGADTSGLEETFMVDLVSQCSRWVAHTVGTRMQTPVHFSLVCLEVRGARNSPQVL